MWPLLKVVARQHTICMKLCKCDGKRLEATPDFWRIARAVIRAALTGTRRHLEAFTSSVGWISDRDPALDIISCLYFFYRSSQRGMSSLRFSETENSITSLHLRLLDVFTSFWGHFHFFFFFLFFFKDASLPVEDFFFFVTVPLPFETFAFNFEEISSSLWGHFTSFILFFLLSFHVPLRMSHFLLWMLHFLLKTFHIFLSLFASF